MNRYRVRLRRTYAEIVDRGSGEVFFRRPDKELVRSVCRDLNESVRAATGERWLGAGPAPEGRRRRAR